MQWIESNEGATLAGEGGVAIARLRVLSSGGVSANWTGDRLWDVSDTFAKVGRSATRTFSTVPEAKEAVDEALRTGRGLWRPPASLDTGLPSAFGAGVD